MAQNLITKAQLLDQNFKIVKKLVMIDSRVYDSEALQYIFNLADRAGSLVFVYDTKKIWANGQYFGGDILSEDLKYFTRYFTFDEQGHTADIRAQEKNDTIQIVGQGFLEVIGKMPNPAIDSDLSKTITLNYNLEKAVNTDFVEINGDRYSLMVDADGKLKLDKYTPVSISIPSLPALEYDDVSEMGWYNDENTEIEVHPISFELKVSTSKPIKHLGIRSVPNIELSQDDLNGNKITAKIPRNIDVTFTAYVEDELTYADYSVTQRWGCGIWYGVSSKEEGYFITNSLDLEELTIDNPKAIYIGNQLTVNATLNQGANEFGYFICPDDLDVEFTDTSTNLSGGWVPYYDITLEKYSEDVRKIYTIYRTEHRGLGSVKWKITVK